MKTYLHLWQYLAEFFLEWEMCQTKVVEKIKTHILCSITLSQKSCRLWDNVEKYGTAGQATYGNIIWRMRFACWITKATGTHSEYLTHCFPTAAMVTRTRLIVRFMYIACRVTVRCMCQPKTSSSQDIVLIIKRAALTERFFVILSYRNTTGCRLLKITPCRSVAGYKYSCGTYSPRTTHRISLQSGF
jgi:hypothetical protein